MVYTVKRPYVEGSRHSLPPMAKLLEALVVVVVGIISSEGNKSEQKNICLCKKLGITRMNIHEIGKVTIGLCKVLVDSGLYVFVGHDFTLIRRRPTIRCRLEQSPHCRYVNSPFGRIISANSVILIANGRLIITTVIFTRFLPASGCPTGAHCNNSTTGTGLIKNHNKRY
jgi:hypothetical protein